MILDEIRSQLENDDVEERANGAKLLANTMESCESDDGIDTELSDLALQAAADDDPTTKYHGTKALSHLIKGDTITKLLANTTVNESGQSYVERIESLATMNLAKSNPGRVRSRSALIVSRLTSSDVDSGASDELIDRLTELLRTGEKQIRRQRAARALANFSQYDRNNSEYVRAQMATAADRLAELASATKVFAQSNGLRAIGFMALSYPEAALPATELHAVVKNSDSRPRNRNRAIRSLGHIGRTHPSVIVPVRSSIEELLYYSKTDAKDSNYLSKDENNLESYAGYIRSNAAMALAQLARDRPELVSESAVERSVDLIHDRDDALHRAMRLLGHVHETHKETIEQTSAKEVVKTYLRDEEQSKSNTKRHTKARGYAIWLVTRLTETDKELEPFGTHYLDYLSSVPISEKTDFEELRTEALANISIAHPDKVSSHESSIDWLLERVVEGSGPEERANAVDALVALLKANAIPKESILQTLKDRMTNEPDSNVRIRITHGLGIIADDSVHRTLAETAVNESNPSVTTAIANSLDSNSNTGRPQFDVDHPLAPSVLPMIPVTEYAPWIQTTVGYGDIERHHELRNGGTGTVYKALLRSPSDAPVSRTQNVVLKIPREPTGTTISIDEDIEACVSEAKKWAKVHGHPNIVTVFGWGVQPEPWIVMEYLEGGELGEYANTNQLPVSQALWIGVCIADALHHAHSFGIYHHDITPSNILLSGHERWPIPKLADWGTAKRRNDKSSEKKYTPGYAAPEQRPEANFTPEVPDKTDLYQLATVVYELLTDQKPFSTAEAVKKQSTTPEPPSTYQEAIPTTVDELLLNTLSPEPYQRPETAAEFRNNLNSCL